MRPSDQEGWKAELKENRWCQWQALGSRHARTDAILWEISSRYLAPEQAKDYMAMSKAQHGEQCVIRMRPERWLSADRGPP